MAQQRNFNHPYWYQSVNKWTRKQENNYVLGKVLFLYEVYPSNIYMPCVVRLGMDLHCWSVDKIFQKTQRTRQNQWKRKWGFTVKKYIGWMIFNHEIPIFHTLTTTRQECIWKFRIERNMTQKAWIKCRKSGRFTCQKVQLSTTGEQWASTGRGLKRREEIDNYDASQNHWCVEHSPL